MASFRPTRSSENPDVDYPPFDPGEWSGSGHLPIWSEVIGAVRFMVNKRVSSKVASQNVAHILDEHWTKRNVYTKTTQNVEKKLESMYKEFFLIRKIFLKGKPSQASLDRYLKFKEEKDRVYDISTEDRERIKLLEKEIGIRMSKAEHDYLKSQTDSKVSRADHTKILCFAKANELDPAWVEQEKNREKLNSYQEKQKLEAQQPLEKLTGDTMILLLK